MRIILFILLFVPTKIILAQKNIVVYMDFNADKYDCTGIPLGIEKKSIREISIPLKDTFNIFFEEGASCFFQKKKKLLCFVCQKDSFSIQGQFLILKYKSAIYETVLNISEPDMPYNIYIKYEQFPMRQGNWILQYSPTYIDTIPNNHKIMD